MCLYEELQLEPNLMFLYESILGKFLLSIIMGIYTYKYFLPFFHTCNCLLEAVIKYTKKKQLRNNPNYSYRLEIYFESHLWCT